MQQLYGSYYVLATLPIWVTALLLYVLTMGVLFVLRDRCEGLYYNTSYSAVIGDGALIVIVLMAAGILQRVHAVPAWVQDERFHFVVATLSICFGVSWWRQDRPRQWADKYHHLFIAPLLAYCLVTLLPVVWGKGTKVEITATGCLFLVWLVFVIYDAATYRLDQRNYHSLGTYINAIKTKKQYS
ncbi:hypothetical protein HY311_01810 [Candidatus Nomurabacteria bacterium]|nr:hypothetical protein [Candidatus Nomurabacteria bacterium]